MFNYTNIQVGRQLTEKEVSEINFIIKSKAHRYIAAGKEEWLYPEEKVTERWQHLGGGYLLMPDPRSVKFTSEILIGYKDGADAFDEYGRKPGQPDFKDQALFEKEWRTSQQFKKDLARFFGPKRRGWDCDFGGPITDDSPEYHAELIKRSPKDKRPRSERWPRHLRNRHSTKN